MSETRRLGPSHPSRGVDDALALVVDEVEMLHGPDRRIGVTARYHSLLAQFPCCVDRVVQCFGRSPEPACPSDGVDGESLERFGGWLW